MTGFQNEIESEISAMKKMFYNEFEEDTVK